MVVDLLAICDFLGVVYDRNYLNGLDDCSKVEYLIHQIFLFLGGSDA